jgi:zinc protease
MITIIILCIVSPSLWASPDIQQWQLKNGARVLFVESHELPMVRVSLVFDAGSSRDARGKEGQSLLTNHLLDEGTEKLSANAVADKLEGLGAELSASADLDMATVGIRSLSDNARLNPALDILKAIVTGPVFPKTSLERERSRLLIGLERSEQSPGDVGQKEYYRLVFGSHPYARPSSGDKRSVKAIKRDDLVQFHRQFYVGSNTIVVIVGDVKKFSAKRIAKHLVGDLPAGKAAPALPDVKPLLTTTEKRIRFPSSQTHIFAGLPGMKRGDPDYFPLYVGNYILGGGGLVSRLSQEIREKRGLSYSTYSYFWPLRKKGPFMMGLQTQNAQAEKALKVMRKTLRSYIKTGPSDKELNAAKKHITGGFPLRLDSSGKIASYLAVIGFYNLPVSYLDDFNGKIEAVTRDQIHDAFKRRVNPGRMVTVVVGGKS